MNLELNKKFQVTKRERVQGLGPSRRQLPPFHYVGKINRKTHVEILKIAEQFENKNDLYRENYNLSKACDLKIPKNHINFLLQEPIKKTDGMNEKDYKIWKSCLEQSLLKEFLTKKFPKLYRARIAVLPPQTRFEWHIEYKSELSIPYTNQKP